MELYLTRGGVCYNLEYSPYLYTISTQSQKITLHFSSQFHLNKYKELIKDHINSLSESLSNRFNFTIEAKIIAYLSLYIKCENRGFFITVDENGKRWNIKCQNNLILNGEKVILPN